MVEPVLHFLKIHREMVFGNSPIIVQDMLRKTPKPLDAVDMVFAATAERLAVIQAVMRAQSLQGVVAPKLVCVVDRPLPRFLPDDRHELLFGYVLHHPCIYLAVALQQAKNHVLAGRASPAPTFSPAAEIALVHLHLAVQLAALKLCDMVDGLSEFLVHARNRLVVGAKVVRETIRRLLLVESLHDGDFRANSLERLLFSTVFVAAPDIPSTSAIDLERTAENALLPPQKVGCATENALSSLCHMDILTPYGYETP